MRERIRKLQTALEAEQAILLPDRRQLAMDAFSGELMLAEREYQAFLDDLDSGQIANQTMDLPGLDELQAQLRPDEALIEYVVTQESVLIFVVPN